MVSGLDFFLWLTKDLDSVQEVSKIRGFCGVFRGLKRCSGENKKPLKNAFLAKFRQI